MTDSRDLMRDALAVLLLGFLVVAFTWQIGLAGRVLAGGDIFTYFYPYWAEATRAIRAGRVPLWNPFLFMGAPFLANSQVGFFYPLNWPLWLLFPPHRSVHLTVVLHLFLAAFNAYAWGRRSLDLGCMGAWAVGAVFALGGYLGAQAEHVNQLQGLAWLPLMLMLYDRASNSGSRNGIRSSGLLGLSTAVGLVFLAGHTQAAFISLAGLSVYGLGPVLWICLREGTGRPMIRRALVLSVAVMIGVLLAGIQVIPTGELAQQSVRARGLPFNERVSFSLSPLYLGRALLPAFGDSVSPDRIEYVAHVGTIGLVLAMIGLITGVNRQRDARSPVASSSQSRDLGLLVLVLLGIFFALGGYNPVYLVLARFAPGFAHFRVPARWLVLYVLGMAAFVGRAVQSLRDGEHPGGSTLRLVVVSVLILIAWATAHIWWGDGNTSVALDAILWAGTAGAAIIALLAARRVPRLGVLGLIALLVGEMYLASRLLPYARATAPQAFTGLRPALTHLLDTDPGHSGPGERFLSMSDTTFDPGDLSLIQEIYGSQLSGDRLYQFVVAAKQKEIASPNLPLAFGVPAVDGYDGGVLPLEHFVTLQRLLLAEDDVSIDGRLRENLTALPEGRWLSLFNVRYLITDKLHDAWIDDVFYDLQHGASLSAGEQAQVAHVPRFGATALGLVSHVEGAPALPEGALVGVVRVSFDSGAAQVFELRLGEQVARVGVEPGETDAPVTRLHWAEPGQPVAVTVEGTMAEGSLIVRGMSLIDERTGSFQSLIISDQGRFRLAHSGDVKVYENLDVLPRAFVVPGARLADDDQTALAAMQDPAFDPFSEVILHMDGDLCDTQIDERLSTPGAESGPKELSRANVDVVKYRPERVVIEADLDEPGYLVLTDAWYPGWQASVDGEPVTVCRADLLFRAIALEPGEHRVTFVFRPLNQVVGCVASSIGLILLIAVSVLHFRRS